jgi:hypothetical protein
MANKEKYSVIRLSEEIKEKIPEYCFFCGHKIRGKKVFWRLGHDNIPEFFCSKKCYENIFLSEKIENKIEKDFGEEWLMSFRLLSRLFFRSIEKLSCSKCFFYLVGVCRGVSNPFDCAYERIKNAKKLGLKPNDVIKIILPWYFKKKG